MRKLIFLLFASLLFLGCVSNPNSHIKKADSLFEEFRVLDVRLNQTTENFDSLMKNRTYDQAQIKLAELISIDSQRFLALNSFCDYLKINQNALLSDGMDLNELRFGLKKCDAFVADSLCVQKWNSVEQLQLQILIKIKQNASYSHLCPSYLSSILTADTYCSSVYQNYSEFLGNYESFGQSILCS